MMMMMMKQYSLHFNQQKMYV